MGQLATIEPAAATVPAFALNDLERIATTIARGGLFGSKDPYAVLTLCLLAHAEGQHPAVVFRDYDLIQGKPAKKAEAMLRDFLNAGGKVVWNRLDDECADATFSHPQGGEVTINWTHARATKAGLGGKDMWKKYPRQMLRSRVVSEGVRTVCPNATSGLYVPEEVRDFAPDTTPADTPATPQPQRARDLKQIEAKPNGNRAKAETWLAEFEAELRDVTDPADEAIIFTKASKALAKLEKDHPDLHALAMALRSTASSDAPVSLGADGGFLNETDAEEGPSQPSDDERPTLADAVAEIDACELVPDVNSKVKAFEGQLSEADMDALRSHATDKVAALKGAAS